MPTVTAAYAAIPTAKLPDATTQINILQRLGGAIGTALFVAILDRTAVPGATTYSTAFHLTFWSLAAAIAVALGAALWLWHNTRQPQA